MTERAPTPGPVRIAVAGAAGRMGRRVIARASLDKAVQLVSAFDRHPDGIDVPAGVRATASRDEALLGIDVLVDFTAPPACAELLPACADRGVACVLASTGLDDAHRAAIHAAVARVPLVVASNYSVGVAVLAELAELCARRFGDSADVEISEIHHHGKRDAPSGTALSLGEAVKRGRPGLDDVLGRAGAHMRGARELGYAALRGGDVSGEHTVYFFAAGERIELTHRASTPDIFADGTLRAARWLAGRTPGLYGMPDVLGAGR